LLEWLLGLELSLGPEVLLRLCWKELNLWEELFGLQRLGLERFLVQELLGLERFLGLNLLFRREW
jgi:hypothetical protein